MTGTRGTSVMEALVGTALAGLALAGLAATAQVSAQALRLARNQGMALAAAMERLEALRAGPRGAGTDAVVTPDGTTFRRTWRVRDGRGAPAALDVDVAWGTHTLALGSEVWP